MTATRVSEARARRNSGVTTRLASGYLLLIAVILLVSAIGIVNIALIRKTYDQVLDVRIPRLGELQGIQELLADLNANAHAALLNTDPEQGRQVVANIDSGRSQVGERLQALQQALQAEGKPEAQELAAQISDDASSVLVGLVKFSRAIRAERREQALATLQDGIKPRLQALSAHIAGYQQEQFHTLAAVKQEVAVKEAAVLMACGFAYGIVRSVVHPLREARAVAAHMARASRRCCGPAGSMKWARSAGPSTRLPRA